jgi:hypothetical protein
MTGLPGHQIIISLDHQVITLPDHQMTGSLFHWIIIPLDYHITTKYNITGSSGHQIISTRSLLDQEIRDHPITGLQYPGSS